MGHILIWIISAISIALMLFRPFAIPEAASTSAGALLICILGLIPWRLAAHAVAEGLDVYLFLAGMMLLSELARVHGVFDWLAGIAVQHANGSSVRLFTLIYAVGTAVTALMSNDATAVVLTPAVLTAVKRAEARPMPYLLTCALIANAASFLLPISNPANLVVFHNVMPPLTRWLAMFLVPSVVAIAITYILLRWYSRRDLSLPSRSLDGDGPLTTTGKITLFGILSVAAVLLLASARRQDLGLPTFCAALIVAAIVLIYERGSPLRLVRGISWSVLPLAATLFIIVEAVKTAGALSALHDAFTTGLGWPIGMSSIAVGSLVGVGTDLVNNLPLGLISGAALQTMPSHSMLSTAVLIGIDLGPNLSITGSLATILWLIALRREGLNVSGWQFLKVGMLVMPLSLLMAITSAILLNSR